MPDDNGPPYEITIKVRDACLCLHVQRAARAMARHFDEALRPVALTNGQFSLLMSLNRPKPPAMGEVAALLAMDRTTLTANLKPLERRGLLTVSIDPTDRRSRRLALTPTGRTLLAKAVPLWEASHAAVERLLADPDRLRADLRALG
ncbi:MAG: MarR family winged helix-turn-helix transcriptional regulator [Rhodospirillales bacterium]|nr:MarR family winged helix-turn-helix transcriptional regulator [Rhodospirillales bacterium]